MTIIERCNHNHFASQLAERLQREEYVAVRMAETAAFEKRARGEVPRKRKQSPHVRTAPAASVATQGEPPTMSNVINIFQAAESTTAHLKAGFMGKQGAGKSATASFFAIGLVRYLQDQGVTYAHKPVAFFDTETGSDWMIPLFKECNIPLVVAKKRSFADLITAVKWAEENASVLIIDSITHPWRELQESYLKSKKRSFLQIDDWSYLKGPYGWQQFSDLYINSKLNIIMCGRAGDETEQYTDENGKRQFEKVGVKMKTETETGFEPSLLVLMERDMDLRSKKVAHTASIVKDRSMLLDGKEFTFQGYTDDGERLPTDVLIRQTWAAFHLHVKQLNVGGAHVGVQTTGDSTHMLKVEKRDWQPVQRKIVLGEIQDLLVTHFPSTGAEDKKKKIAAIRECFDAGWVEVEEIMALVDLRAGYDLLHEKLEGRPSKYGTAIRQDATAAVLNDALPEFAAAAG